MMNKDVIVSKTKDLEKCYSIRKKVFIDEQGVPKNLELDEEDNHSYHFLARVKETAVGCARARRINGDIKIERVAVLKEFRRNGIAKDIMKYIEEYFMEKEDFDLFILNAQESVISFYLELGYVGVDDIFVEAGIKHLKMKKDPQF